MRGTDGDKLPVQKGLDRANGDCGVMVCIIDFVVVTRSVTDLGIIVNDMLIVFTGVVVLYRL